MEWFSRRTSIGRIQIPNWMVVLGAVIVILLAHSFMHRAGSKHYNAHDFADEKREAFNR